MKIVLNVKYSVPSLNKLFAMNPWGRHRERKKAQAALLSALRDAGSVCSTLTISQEAAKALSTAYDTLVCYMAIPQSRSNSLSVKSKSKPNRRNGL